MSKIDEAQFLIDQLAWNSNDRYSPFDFFSFFSTFFNQTKFLNQF